MIMRLLAVVAVLLASSAMAKPVVLTNGLIVDGSGDAPYAGWLAMEGDRITGIGKGTAPTSVTNGATVSDVKGQAISP
jgi:N-acyl-D-amino-acid deacylase